VEAPVAIFLERPIDETVSGFFGSDDVSNRRASTNPSLAPSSHSSRERSQSVERPASSEAIPQTSFFGSGLPSQDDDEALHLSSDPHGSPGNTDLLNSGQSVLKLHQAKLLQMFYEDDFKRWFNIKRYFNRSQGTTTKSSCNGSEKEQTDGSRRRGHIEVNIAELQRMRMRKLQIKLVYQAVQMRYSGKESKDWEETLQQYSMCHAMPKMASD